MRQLSNPQPSLLRDKVFRRLWVSTLIASFGGQITILAIPLTAALFLRATPIQMGLMTAVEILPFVLLSLPAGVVLDRIRLLPIYIAGEISVALALASVTFAWWFSVLSMKWLYAIGFLIGAVNTMAGAAGQVLLTQMVPRSRLVEANARKAFANAIAEIAGPAVAGSMIKMLGGPVALLADAFLLGISATIVRKLPATKASGRSTANFWRALREGLMFVRKNELLVSMAYFVGIWQFCGQSAASAQILFATRELGLSERAIGLGYVALGVGTVLASTRCRWSTERFGAGLTMVFGFCICGGSWLLLAVVPLKYQGILVYAVMLLLNGIGGVFITINFLALRQSVTPDYLLGRMTSTMRWLILTPAVPGALFGGWLGETFGLRATLAFAGIATLLLAGIAWRSPVLRSPQPMTALDREFKLLESTAIQE